MKFYWFEILQYYTFLAERDTAVLPPGLRISSVAPGSCCSVVGIPAWIPSFCNEQSQGTHDNNNNRPFK